jgi:hypothetical protein
MRAIQCLAAAEDFDISHFARVGAARRVVGIAEILRRNDGPNPRWSVVTNTFRCGLRRRGPKALCSPVALRRARLRSEEVMENRIRSAQRDLLGRSPAPARAF